MHSTRDNHNALLEAISLLRASNHPVAMTGAGMSADSGIPTFRGTDSSLWHQWAPETLASADAFRKDKALVWGWHTWRMACVATATPNPGHLALAQLESLRPLFSVVTQNVDDLHERAGSTRVAHLHGNIFAPRCFACARPHDGLEIPASAALTPSLRLMPPQCKHCGGYIRPGVIWFGEQLPAKPWQQAETWIRNCDLLLVAGTSGSVQPAASLVNLAQRLSAKIVLIDPAPTAHSNIAHVHVRLTVAEALPAIVAGMNG